LNIKKTFCQVNVFFLQPKTAKQLMQRLALIPARKSTSNQKCFRGKNWRKILPANQ